MSYNDQAALARDEQFRDRIAACYATQDQTGDQQPVRWADAHQWQLSAAPGFADAYASAIAGGVPDPGADPSVISDAQILSAVQAALGGG